MNLLKCQKGHYYDGDAYSQCPYCKNSPEQSSIPLYTKSQDSQIIPSLNKNITPIIERIISWLFYSVFFSALPIGMYTFLNDLFEFGINNTDKYISVLFVVTLVISSTTLKDIIDNKFWKKRQTLFLIIFLTTFFMVLLSSTLYGAVTYCFLSNATISDVVKWKLLTLSIIISGFSVLIGLLMQILGGISNELQP